MEMKTTAYNPKSREPEKFKSPKQYITKVIVANASKKVSVNFLLSKIAYAKLININVILAIIALILLSYLHFSFNVNSENRGIVLCAV